MKIALFGGTFNPPHLGHRRLLDSFCSLLAFDRVFVVPDKRPVHKICDDLALDNERLQMCRLAFDDPAFTVSSMEIDRESDSYTVYTVRELHEQYPGAEIYLLMGSDMFLSFHKWYKYREIFEKYYPGQSEMITDFWMPNKEWEGCNVNDPSARVLSNYGNSGC